MAKVQYFLRNFNIILWDSKKNLFGGISRLFNSVSLQLGVLNNTRAHL